MSGIIAAAAVVVVSTATSLHYQNRAAQQSRAANRKAARIEAVQAQRNRARAIAENRVNAAQVEALGANQGLSSSSGIQGALGSLGSQGAANEQFANVLDQLNMARMQDLSRAGANTNRANTATQIGSAVASIAGAAGGGGAKVKTPAAQDYAIGGSLGPTVTL